LNKIIATTFKGILVLKVTELLAIYAACLSTIVFIWNVTRAIPRVKVKIVYGTDKIEEKWITGVYISVHLSNISILYPSSKKRFIDFISHILKYRRFSWTVGWVLSSLSNYELECKCPLSLASGKSYNVFIPQRVLDKILKDSERREIKAVVQDELWRNKYSRKFMVS
jgi:hypothetical protein